MVPVILTMDLEIANDYHFNGQRDAVYKILEILNNLNTRFTAFCTADAALVFYKELRELQSTGNEIGCHGLAHRKDENYKILPHELTSKHVKEATRQINEITGTRPVSFRGPRMSTSTVLQKILIEENYTSESAVCPQRIDITNSIGGQFGWLTSPRMPYYPSENSPFKKGSLQLLEIPLSSFLLPYISAVLYIAGLEFMKSLFRLFYLESELTGKPIVYLFHTYEFAEYSGVSNNCKTGNERSKLSLHRFYCPKSKDRFAANVELIKYMRSFNDIKFFTCKEYTNYFNERNNI